MPDRVSAQELAYLRVASSPSGAQIAIDGRTLSVTGPDFESSAVLTTTAGSHELRVFLPDVGEDQFSITLFAGDTLEVFVELGSAEQMLAITSEPPGADVTINGVEMGQTPLENLSIMGGDYTVSLTRACYLPYTRQVSVSARPSYDLHAELRQSVVLASPAPDQITELSLCQTGRAFEGRYTLVPGPTGDATTKWEVMAALVNSLGESTSARLSGDLNKTMSTGSKSFTIELPGDADLNDTLELRLRTVPKQGGSGNSVLTIGGLAVLAVGGGVAAAVLLGGGDGANGGSAGPPLPPGRPQ